MSDSILTTTKKALGLAADYDAFDPEIVMFINTVFSRLDDLGVGPEGGYAIEDENDLWSTYLNDDPILNRIQSYMYLRVKMLFDPPTTSFLMNAIDAQIDKMEWLINAHWERDNWVDPTISDEDLAKYDILVDGGVI